MDERNAEVFESDASPEFAKARQQEDTLVGSREHISQFFEFKHLPPALQEISALFKDVADLLVKELPRNPERTVALRKLLEAKDASVRARLAQ